MDHRGGRQEGDAEGDKEPIRNTTIIEPACEFANLRTSNNPPNVACQVWFSDKLSGRYSSAVIPTLQQHFNQNA